MAKIPDCAVVNCPDRGWPRLLKDPQIDRTVGIAVCKRHQNAIDRQGATYSIDVERRLILGNEPKPGHGLVVDDAQASYGPIAAIGDRGMRLKIRGWSLEAGGPDAVELVLDEEAAEQLRDYLGTFLH